MYTRENNYTIYVDFFPEQAGVQIFKKNVSGNLHTCFYIDSHRFTYEIVKYTVYTLFVNFKAKNAFRTVQIRIVKQI